VKSTNESQPGPSTCPPNRLSIPPALSSDVLAWAHASKLICHPGMQRTQDFLLQCFWWATLEEDTREVVNACPACNRHKPSHQVNHVPIPKLPSAKETAQMTTSTGSMVSRLTWYLTGVAS